MGCCCIHVTFQTKSLEEVRFVYDQMTPLTPIILTLSASAPIWRGYLADIDCRWNVIRDAMDDRSPDELGKEPLKKNHFLIRKSRFDTTDTYVSRQGESYNDYEFPFDPKTVEKLKHEGMDEVLAKHFASLFIKDPFIVSADLREKKSDDFIGNFEMLLNTNWRMLRLKTPPLKSDENNKLGWRIEFRPTELQLTDFENAAIKTFIILLARAIISNKNVNFLVPITKVDANMQTACKRNACLNERFFFRRNMLEKDQDCQLETMFINEIINGSEHFKGLIPFINDYLDTLVNMKPETRLLIENYLKVFEYRASGKLPTPASWMRQFVDRHPMYTHDSRINDEINYDLINKIIQISSENIENIESLVEHFAEK
jgi:glutamate--cysteine ligase catalytic subunit